MVDDGSTDSTLEYLASQGARIRVVSIQNSGSGAARNAGLEVSNGEYIAFLDSDDVFFPWTLESYRKVIASNHNPSFIAGNPFRFTDEKRLEKVSQDDPDGVLFSDYYKSSDKWRWWGASSFVIKTECLRSVGGFSDKKINGEDADLAMKLGVYPGFFQIMSPYTFGYREHNTNITTDLNKTVSGVWNLIRVEKCGMNQGGSSRSLDRLKIITRSCRPVAIECLKQGNLATALHLYNDTFYWNFRLHRYKYLIGFILQFTFNFIIKYRTCLYNNKIFQDSVLEEKQLKTCSKPFISVIIPTLNRLDLLKKTISSVKKQDFDNYEIIIVDDGSSDGTVEEFQDKSDSVRFFTQNHQGPGAARNLGALNSRGEYLTFLDSDDVWFPWTLSTIVEVIKQGNYPSVVGGSITEFSEDSELTFTQKAPLSFVFTSNYADSQNLGSFVGAGMLTLKKDCFMRVGGFINLISICEDHDMMLRISKAHGYISIKSPVTVAWRRHLGSITKNQILAVKGIKHMISTEKQDGYPGGLRSKRWRCAMICYHSRPISFSCIDQNMKQSGWEIYFSTFIWNILLGRFRYILGFPIIAFFK